MILKYLIHIPLHVGQLVPGVQLVNAAGSAQSDEEWGGGGAGTGEAT